MEKHESLEEMQREKHFNLTKSEGGIIGALRFPSKHTRFRFQYKIFIDDRFPTTLLIEEKINAYDISEYPQSISLSFLEDSICSLYMILVYLPKNLFHIAP